ncbi:DM13 domain-containing protein [Oscillatoria sp. CS-180]|uniref:DM13 domain-containing protein n=1 Tax=Oscillatoria sp. CS-180 TaxID=3021720 RepID=UPI002330DF74|nr:DM13 domain-containing protein [Oscillatoria sp. CS-180]MDB9527502.1 DM13 domain-containing protein [Oscillatoria sp. CS-180]
MRLSFIAYSILAGVTPALVLANSILSSGPTRPVQPLYKMALTDTLMDSEPKTLVRAYKLMDVASENPAQAQIVQENGQTFLEFYHSLNTPAQMPRLILILDTAAEPDSTFVYQSDRHLKVGDLEKSSGQHRYPLPSSIDLYQYSSVVIWCPELNTTMGYMPIVKKA